MIFERGWRAVQAGLLTGSAPGCTALMRSQPTSTFAPRLRASVDLVILLCKHLLMSLLKPKLFKYKICVGR